MHPFSTLMKTSENRKVFRCFQGGRERYIGNIWVKVVNCSREKVDLRW